VGLAFVAKQLHAWVTNNRFRPDDLVAYERIEAVLAGAEQPPVLPGSPPHACPTDGGEAKASPASDSQPATGP
jgi:hypothetical protein